MNVKLELHNDIYKYIKKKLKEDLSPKIEKI